MVNVAVAGAQWGDEGKGKVVDVLAPRFEYVIRFQGGPNAGHSVVFDGERFALHVLPSGIFHKGAINVVANGVVVDPFSFQIEIDKITSRGIHIGPDNLKISDRAHLILPYHGIIDRHLEAVATGRRIGTTGRGIGPAYEWKIGRRGIRFCDLFDRELLLSRLEEELDGIRSRMGDLPELRELSAQAICQRLEPVRAQLLPLVTDTVALLAQARAAGKSMLFEGAQATLLDIDFGTYPYVTSSNSCSLGVPAGAGVPLRTVQRVIGICKAYATRVGMGPFTTELLDEVGDCIRKVGNEFGTTTGRPRRCGWLDMVALRYAHRLNGFDSLAIMKLDVLDGLPELKVCEAYELPNGEQLDTIPASLALLEQAKPRYRSFPGWPGTVTAARTFAELPQEARTYLEAIETSLGCPVGLISVGPDREQTILREREFFGG